MHELLEGYKQPEAYFIWLATFPVVLSLIIAAFLMLIRNTPKAQGKIALVANIIILFCSMWLYTIIEANGVFVVKMGGWSAPFGIIFAVDQFGALFCVFAAIIGVIITAFSMDVTDNAERRFGFFPLLMLLLAGVHGAFLTGDIFNLYVWFEVMVIASFGLLILGGRHKQLDGAIKYTFINLLATSFFLISVGLLYGLTGSLNIADLSIKLSEMGDDPVLLVIALLMMAAFLMKSAVFPLGMWLPASYHTPKIVVSALMASLLTKAGLYAFIKTSVMLFPSILASYNYIFMWLGIATSLIGGFGALAHSDIRRMAGYLVISGVGTIIIGLSLNTFQGLSGALFYATQSILLMAAIFMCAGLIRVSGGSYDAHRVTSLYRRDPYLSVLFLMLMIAISGLPPFSNLWAKMMLVESAVKEGQIYPIIALLLSSFLTLIALGRMWLHMFWGERLPLAVLHRPERQRMSHAFRGGRPYIYTLILVLLSLCFGLFPDVLMKRTDAAVASLRDLAPYQQRVLIENGTNTEITGQPNLDYRKGGH